MTGHGSWTRRRLSRRRLLAGSAAGAAGLAIAACSGGGEEEPQPGVATATAGPAGAPKRGGRYVYASTADFGTLDPVESVAFATAIFPRIYNALVVFSPFDPDFIYLDLASEIEQPDEETYVYGIRPGVTIAPNDLGVPERDLDALDALRWLEHVQSNPEAVAHSFMNAWLASFEAPDAGSLTIKTSGPYAYFLLRMGGHLGGTLPPREFFEQEIDLDRGGVGAGPFAIRPGSYNEGGGIKLDRNPNRSRSGLPFVDGIDFVALPDRQPRRTAFIDKQIYEYDADTFAEMEELRDRIPDVTVAEQPTPTFVSLAMNPSRPPWNDERIRKAALYALNRQEFVDLIVDGAGQPNGLVHWPVAGYALDPEELERLQPHDPARSRELIREATGEDSIAIRVMYPANIEAEFHSEHVPVFERQMREAGFEIEGDPLALGGWLQNYADLNYDASLALNQYYETAEIPLDFHSASGPLGDGLYVRGIGALYAEVEEAIRASKAETDTEAHREAVKSAQRLIYSRGPAFLPIFSWTGFTLYHSFVKNPPGARGLGTASLFLSDFWLDR